MTLFKSIWYVTVTASTVGYGDLLPVSFMGKVTGIVIITMNFFTNGDDDYDDVEE